MFSILQKRLVDRSVWDGVRQGTVEDCAIVSALRYFPPLEGIVGMRGSMIIRLRAYMICAHPPCSSRGLDAERAAAEPLASRGPTTKS